MLNELDWELEKRGHAFVRYANDYQIYVSRQRAGEWAKQSISDFIEQTLRLKVNIRKSAVARPWKRKFWVLPLARAVGIKLKSLSPPWRN